MIKIYQIYFNKSQIISLDPNFIPYYNPTLNKLKEYEIGVHIENYENKNYLNAKYTGFISWKFNEKTKISGEHFINFIEDNKGFDVYFINPFPQLSKLKNVWIQGNQYHPEIMEFTQKLFDKIGYHIILKELTNHNNTLLYCNYWVGNKIFWNEYINFIKPLYNYIKHNMTAEETYFLSKKAAKYRNANYFPFIFERMFSTFLVTNKKNLRYLAFVS